MNFSGIIIIASFVKTGQLLQILKGLTDTFWWGNLRERDQWGDPGLDLRINLKWIFRKWDVGVCTGLRWLKIETGGGQL
jgi:hypothetical protein